jgi:hypothetical protein
VRISDALYNLSFVGWGLADEPPEARANRRAMIEEAVAVSRAAKDDLGAARALWALAMLEEHAGNLDAGLAAVNEAIVSFRAHGDLFDLSWALQTFGLIHIHTGDLVSARTALNEQLMLVSEVGDLRGISVALGDHSELAMAEGNRDKAVRLAGACGAFRHKFSGGLGAYSDMIMGRIVKPTDEDRKAFDEGFAMSVDDAVRLALTPS